MPGNDDGGDWPSKNWVSNSWGKGPELFDYYSKNNFIKGYGCYHGCTIGCARWVQVADGEFKTPEHGGAEYESMSCFTAYVMNTDVRRSCQQYLLVQRIWDRYHLCRRSDCLCHGMRRKGSVH